MATEAQIKATIARYQETFSSGDKQGWLGLFVEDGTVEDPVGSVPRKGRAEIGQFWDEVHATLRGITTEVTMGPAVAGHEAALAFEARLELDNGTFILPIIDVMTFADDGRLVSMRAFVDGGSLRPAS
jgi:steroid delta-isomerase